MRWPWQRRRPHDWQDKPEWSDGWAWLARNPKVYCTRCGAELECYLSLIGWIYDARGLPHCAGVVAVPAPAPEGSGAEPTASPGPA